MDASHGTKIPRKLVQQGQQKVQSVYFSLLSYKPAQVLHFNLERLRGSRLDEYLNDGHKQPLTFLI